MRGYPGQGWHGHHHGWGQHWGGPPMMRGWHHRPHFAPFGFFMFLPGLFLLGFLFFGLLKFLWPLLAIGFIIMGVKMVMSGGGAFPHGRGNWRDWQAKRKNEWNAWDDKPKRNGDERRYTQTEDGEWVEIV